MFARPADVSGGLIYLTFSSLWVYSVLCVVSVVGFVAQLGVFVVTWPFDRNRHVAGLLFRQLSCLVVKASWLWRFDVSGSTAKPFAGAAVVVSNHESHCDAFLISHLGWEMKWLAKRSLFRIPFIGWLMALAGDVPITRGNKASAEQAMHAMRRYLERGMPVFLFPEGTRAVTEDLLPFKAGAFRLALDAQVPLVPLAVAGTRSALTKHSWKFGTSRARLVVGTPIDTVAVARAMRKGHAEVPTKVIVDELARRTREQIVALRVQLHAQLAALAPSSKASVGQTSR